MDVPECYTMHLANTRYKPASNYAHSRRSNDGAKIQEAEQEEAIVTESVRTLDVPQPTTDVVTEKKVSLPSQRLRLGSQPLWPKLSRNLQLLLSRTKRGSRVPSQNVVWLNHASAFSLVSSCVQVSRLRPNCHEDRMAYRKFPSCTPLFDSILKLESSPIVCAIEPSEQP
jgi:hypothetical protein